MALDINNHPCFNRNIKHKYGRIHLPIAPKCNIQCKFCNRKFDCVNESRPGVASAILSPGQAMVYLKQAVEKDPRIKVVGIAGPGDPFANADETMETLESVRETYPEMLLCVATNGLNVAPYVERLARLKVSHVTVTLNAISPTIAAKVYAWVRDDKRVLRKEEGARLLIERQLEAIRLLKNYGVTVKVNTIIMPGINDEHVLKVAAKAAELGADLLNCMPIFPVEGSALEDIEQPSADRITRIRVEASKFVPQMHHCTRCRADAAGLLGESLSKPMLSELQKSAQLPLRPEEERPYVAVGSLEGVLVNQHLGETSHLWIFGKTDAGFQVVDTRETPEAGTGQERWRLLADTLKDCRSLLVSGIGPTPQKVLTEQGIKVIEMVGLIEPTLEAIYSGAEVRVHKRKHRACGAECAGSGVGCS